ncbi:hypothetical protein [Sphingopyxis sp.]|uniref:hypothetical protein n=1 Tax=Sphingopyxis sp. TaxID=1908224 RepID=UPI003D6C728D
MKRDLPAELRGVWPKLSHNYAIARAELALADALGSEDGETKNDAYTAAIDAILLTPAECAADIRLKIEVMNDHNVTDGWWCAEEALAMLAIDARGLLPALREGVRS